MLWVRTFSVFLPSMFNSCVVWLNPGAAHKPSSAAHSRIFFMTCLRISLNPPTGLVRARAGSWQTITVVIPARVDDGLGMPARAPVRPSTFTQGGPLLRRLWVQHLACEDARRS